MESVTERLREPFGGIDEIVFGPAPADAIGWDLKHIFAQVMGEWAAEIPSALGAPEPPLAECHRMLRRHSRTDPDARAAKEDYITRELHKKGMTA